MPWKFASAPDRRIGDAELGATATAASELCTLCTPGS